MTYDIDNLCDCCRKNEKDRTCIGCRELAIEVILEENQELKKQLEHYKTQEIERINKKLLDTEHKYLESCIKAIR